MTFDYVLGFDKKFEKKNLVVIWSKGQPWNILFSTRIMV